MTTPNRADRRSKKSPKVTPAASTAAAFKKKSDVVTLPSGNRVKMRRPGMIHFLEAGILPDPLAELIKKEVGSRNGKSVSDADLIKQMAAGDNIKLITESMRATDRIVAFCVYEPPFAWHERELPHRFAGEPVAYEDIPEDERDPEIVYTDEVELEDKMFIFQLAVGGSHDLTRFRATTGSIVGALSAGEGVVETPK